MQTVKAVAAAIHILHRRLKLLQGLLTATAAAIRAKFSRQMPPLKRTFLTRIAGPGIAVCVSLFIVF